MCSGIVPSDIVVVLVQRPGAGEYDPLGGQIRGRDKEDSGLGILVNLNHGLENAVTCYQIIAKVTSLT